MKLTIAFAQLMYLSMVMGPIARGEYKPIAPGLDYEERILPGPVKVYIARADRTKDTWTIDSMIAKGTIKGARETVPDMARRYNDTVNFRGQRYDVKLAINGSYFNLSSGTLFGGQIIGGWFARRFPEYGGGSGFVWTLDRKAMVGGNVNNAAKLQQAIFPDGTALKLDKLNEPLGNDELGLYTWHYAERTDAGDQPVEEAVVAMSAPACIMPDNGGTPGKVTEYRKGHGGTPLLYDHVVLAARGKAAQRLNRLAARGNPEVRIDLALKDFGSVDIGLAPAGWRGAYASIDETQYLLVNGKVTRQWEKKAAQYAKEGKKHGSVVKDPRTLVAFNDRYIWFVVIDGRSTESIGMTFTDAGEFCRTDLKAAYAVNQDGGGSSTMWVDGEVRNNPSGKVNVDKAGQLRAVANGYLMAAVEPAKRSTAFKTGAAVATAAPAELRLGPGTHFGVATTLPANAPGRLIAHPLAGVQAKGKFWWPCRFTDAEGWLPEESLPGK